MPKWVILTPTTTVKLTNFESLPFLQRSGRCIESPSMGLEEALGSIRESIRDSLDEVGFFITFHYRFLTIIWFV